MRVLIDGRVRGPDGIGRYTRCVIAGLCRSSPSDLEVAVLEVGTAQRYSRAAGDELLSGAVEYCADLVHTLDYRVPVTPAAQFPTIITVHDVLRLRRPELCYSNADFASRFGELAYAKLREVVADLRELAPFPAPRVTGSRHEEYLGRMLALAVHQAEHVITPTETVARQLCDVVPAQDKLCVSPWGVDHSSVTTGRPPAGVPDRYVLYPDRYVLYVGQARPHKGLPALLSAIPRTALYRDGVSLVLVGRDFEPGSPAARVAADTLGSHRVWPVGEVSDAELAALYAGADALVHLADDEGFGFPPLEALAHGRPVIASDLPVLRETLGSCATFVNPADPDDVAAQLDAAVAADEPAARAKRIQWATRFRWQRHIHDLITCYWRVVPG